MREKYVVQQPFCLGDLEDAFGIPRLQEKWALGLRYDSKENRVMIGGPLRFVSIAENVCKTAFGKSFNPFEVKTEGSRFRAFLQKIHRKSWNRGIRLLKEKYEVFPVRSFRRLCS